MFKAGTYLSRNKLGEYSVSGVQHYGGPNEQVSGSFFSGSAFGILDVWGYYDRKRMAFSSAINGGGDTSVQASKTSCTVTSEANSCCGTDSYGNPNTCDVTRFGGSDFTAYSYGAMFTGYTASQFKDVAVSGDGGVDFATYCNTNNCAATWGTYSNNTYAVIKADGTLWIWGDNPYGQVGNGTTTGQFDPVQIGSDTTWEKIIGGQLYFLALKQDGTLWAWGYNNYGQLGDGTTTNRSSPVQIGSDTTWVQVSAGVTHAVAVKSDGTLWAWGNNYWGTLGDSSTANKSSPVQVSGTTWKKAAAGSDNTVALRTDGTMWSWGYNTTLNVGDGTTTSRSSPVQIGSGNTWKDCKVQYAISTDHKLYSWGTYNSYGGAAGATPAQIGTDANYSTLPTGYQLGIFVSGLSNPGNDTGLAVIDRTGGIQVFTSTGNSGKSNVYVGGGVRKVVGSYTGIFILKDAFSAYKGPDGSGSPNTIMGPNPSSLYYGHSTYFPTPQTVLIDVPGTHSIAVPPNVDRMHVVCVGGGGSGGSGDSFGQDGAAGGGGALAYKNSITVTPGDTVRVVVGHGGGSVGFGSTSIVGNAGGPSYVVYNSTSYAYAGGGSGGANSNNTSVGGTRGSGTYDGGGDGGNGGASTTSVTGGGGGAGGYSGNGGNGGNISSYGAAGSGGGGGGGNQSVGGGGVGIIAQGTSGAGGSLFNAGGNGGSGGTNGGTGYGSGGTYGGGGSGGFYDSGASFASSGAGGRGAVRILFSNQGSGAGVVRTYPGSSGDPTLSYTWV